MIKKVLIITAGIALLFCSCSEDEESITAKYRPLAAGNEWKTAESYEWDISGFTNGSSTSTTEYSVDSLETRDDGKQVWPVTHTTYAEGVDTLPVIEYYHVTEDSVSIYLTKDAEEPSMVEPNNLAVNMEWDGQLSIPVNVEGLTLSNLPSHFKVVGTESVTVTAGTFNTFVIRVDIDYGGETIDSALTEWRAENVGRVKMDTDFITSITIFTQTYDAHITGTSELTEKNW
ncbi:hypothetical protein GF359_04235 [candidate division WOR-3 bacterium]|uniref:DUF3108 domain-containing protein n=1 Tax=candidate division WOR-3 bacterium TaxID=2052148 RepID=A0A9D5QCU2_UNCW3|nr:hypothetical protein [candidate division WOR-3 bacterium]MBD3364407.1 hypothetical protein [candidate division WOR-3 bacterium]